MEITQLVPGCIKDGEPVMIGVVTYSPKPLTPAEFADKMRALYPQPEGVDKYDWSKRGYNPEEAHETADNLIAELLIALGYDEGGKIFDGATRWFG